MATYEEPRGASRCGYTVSIPITDTVNDCRYTVSSSQYIPHLQKCRQASITAMADRKVETAFIAQQLAPGKE